MGIQKMYCLYGLKHQIVEINGDVTDAGRTDERQTMNEQGKIVLLSQWMAEFRNFVATDVHALFNIHVEKSTT